MVKRYALRQHPVLLAAVVLLGAWLLLSAMNVFVSMGQTGPFEGYVGHTPASGWAGLAVIVALLGFLVVLYSELGEPGPLPESFPPETARGGAGQRRVHRHTDRSERMASARTDHVEPKTYYKCTQCGTVSASDEAVAEPHARYCEVCDAETEWVPAEESGPADEGGSRT
ncbi:hypothetical protein [Halostella sp. PRR32]|uniref:hypothetical protein n=1 Tax=Halostella sp. PRR32 TaxID=3098147 RepID=UPI002B1D1E94|nr:hypothetical protein [Halostella sp. PRR32]